MNQSIKKIDDNLLLVWVKRATSSFTTENNPAVLANTLYEDDTKGVSIETWRGYTVTIYPQASESTDNGKYHMGIIGDGEVGLEVVDAQEFDDWTQAVGGMVSALLKITNCFDLN